MASIFDITGDNFFTPLSSKNKKIYFDSIFFLHGLINELFESEENEKNKVVDALTRHLNDMVEIPLYDDRSNEEIIDNTNDNLLKARFIINSLENYGWLVEESVGDGKIAIDFSIHSYSFISLMENLIANRKPSYTGFVRVIKDIAYNFNYTKIDNLEIIDKQLSDFVVSLRGLRSSIQRYYKNITKNKDSKDLEALLDEFTGDYKDTFFDSAYLRLKITDNVDSEIPKLEKQLELIFGDFLEMEKLVNARIDKEYKDYDAASKYVYDAQKRILTNIRTIPSLIKMIDSKNNKYVSRSVSVIIHLINRGEDINGILNRLISYVVKGDITDKYLSLFEMKQYSFDLLARPKKISVKTNPEVLPLDLKISDETKENALKILKEDTKYNIKSINNFVLEFLGDIDQRKISELDIKSNYEFIMIICIIMYSKLYEALYELKRLDERISQKGISFNNFIVRKKGGIYYD